MDKEIVVGGNMHLEGVSQDVILEKFTIPIPQAVTDDFLSAAGVGIEEIPLGHVDKLIVAVTTVGLGTSFQRELRILPSRGTVATLRAQVVTDEGEERNLVVSLRGLMKATDAVDIGDGLTKSSFEFVCNYYKYEVNGERLHEIDLKNKVIFIGSKDEYPNRKNALAM